MFGDASGRYLGINLRLARLRGLLLPVMAAATGSGTLIVLFMGGRLVIGGVITLGDFVAFSGYLAMLVWPTAVMGWLLTLAQRGAASMSRLSAILGAEPAVADGPDAEPLMEVGRGLELRRLSFGYGESKVLDRVSCSIAAGERVGITGEVGSGKSTLLKLIPRLLPVADGQIFIDGRDINHVTLASLRSLIGYVPQEAFLFSRSIRENFGYGAAGGLEGAGDLVRRAGLTADVERFHEGLETEVGEKGVTLSGGQKQRISIARALSADPPILLLDDPLSAVDAAREEDILDELDRIGGDHTLLIVSQRLSAFRGCDRVLVLKDGGIAEEGSPSELLQRDGLYAAMYRRQRLQEELL
jgi:ATP-binding cassette subfamily B protein